jgi:hypothetical protein
MECGSGGYKYSNLQSIMRAGEIFYNCENSAKLFIIIRSVRRGSFFSSLIRM